MNIEDKLADEKFQIYITEEQLKQLRGQIKQNIQKIIKILLKRKNE